jgi:benzoyl-CoA reductase/2-hydroxyglutaryl-CoA dehydratase subunit BcrC/BadD/HgdB
LETTIKSEAFQQFCEATESIINSEVREWQDRGGKVVGFFCSTVPEELFTAAGLLPFRMRGTGSTSTERKVGQPQIDWYYDELNILKEQLEKHFEVELGDERVEQAIRLHNEVRSLQKELYQLRKADRPPITGTETLAVMVAGTAMPKQRYKELLSELLDELRQSEGNGEYRARLMVVGGELDDPEYIRIVEEQGGLVVADSTCFGSRLMWKPVNEEEPDPIRALASYYIYDRPSCPRMYGDQPRRIEYTRELAKEFKVDGIIGERLLFCDQWLVEHYMTGLDLKQDGIPFLTLDREYILSGKGQLRTRVQAFLETIESTGS